MRVTLTVTSAGRRTDVAVDADDDATVDQLAASVGSVTGGAGALHLGDEPLDGSLPLRSAGLLDGQVLGLGEPAPQLPSPAGRGWQLHVVAGPDTGTVVALPAGEHDVGRSAAISLGDAAMSRRHALLTVSAAGLVITDLDSVNGTTVDGVAVSPRTPAPVGPGAVLGMGDTLLVVRQARSSDAATEAADPGWLSFLRPPRLQEPTTEATVLLPTPPTPPAKRRFPLVAMLVPLLLGVVMAVVLHAPAYLLFTLASPVMLLSNHFGDSRAAGKDHRRALEEHASAMAAAQRRFDEAVGLEQERLRTALPDAPEVLLTAVLPGRRLWERRRADSDALTLRLGLADLPTTVRVEGRRRDAAEDDAPRLLHAVPVPVPLREVGVLGVAGPSEARAGLLRWLVVQLAVHHAPRDLTLTVLTDSASEHWAWVRWLPHARPRELDSVSALVGNDPDTVTARVAELLTLVRSRQDAERTGGRGGAERFAAHVVVVDGAQALRATPGLAQVLQDGPAVGVYALCADAEVRLLPESCLATADLSADGTHLVLQRSGAAPVPTVVAERVTAAWAEDVARALSPLKDTSDDAGDVALPDSARLLDVLGLEPPTVDGVRARWLVDGSTTTVALGAGLDGPFRLDLRRDGPHGLIAGTTGSGKSELLQTVVASLAVANRPDAMNFVLVDYKGGSAFKDCVHLPHTVGMVTDLDNHLVERALTSLGAELKHREHVLAAAGAKDLEDYVDLRAKDGGLAPLPRLLIVIDEFASMARELPDFVTGLVNIAQRGRSLGIHLLLATQRPSGVVSPEIRANTNLRISLRVTDAADSTDVLEAPDAARIPKSAPGRGYARLGAGALVPFQAGRVGGRRPGVRPAHVAPPYVAAVGWRRLGHAAPTAPRSEVQDDVEQTDLSVLVQVVRQAAALDGALEQRSPWLPALPDRLLLADLAPTATGLPYGTTDLPHQQQRRTAVFDPARHGHLLVVGSARSGRSQLLRTLGASAGERDVADLHLYALDCGNGALLPLAELPHCGAVVLRNQTERAARLLTRLSAELDRRQQLLSAGGYADVEEQRARAPQDERLPHVVLLLDRWEGFTATLGEVDGGRLADIVLAVLREGASVGIHAVITGDRSLAAGRIASLVDDKLCLRLADKGDYSLLGLHPRQVPEAMAAGRALAAGSGLETQVALLDADDSGQAQAAALSAVAERARARDAERPAAQRPFRVDVLPARVTLDEAWALVPAQPPSPYALVGVGGDELAALGTDFTGGPTFVLAGPGRSGRSTALCAMARSVLRSGGQVLVVAPRPSPLRDLAGTSGVLAVVTDAGEPVSTYDEALDAAPAGVPVVVVVDDGELVRDCPASELFRDVVKGQSRPGTYLVLGGNAEGICTGLSGWQVEAKKSRQGLLLSPQGISDGDLIGVRLSRSVVGQPVQPGRGWLHLGDSTVTAVAVPVA